LASSSLWSDPLNLNLKWRRETLVGGKTKIVESNEENEEYEGESGEEETTP
jgi:hypothetical protein